MRLFVRRLWLASAGLGLFTCFFSAQAADKIIVSGASGQLGGLAVQELLTRGVKPADLILVSHTPEKLSAYAKMGAAVRFGDLTKPESLPAAYEGGTKMLLISVGRLPVPSPVLHKAGIDAAVKAGVKHIVYTSFLGADKPDSSPIAADHYQTEQYLKASGAKWTLLRNAGYANGAVDQAVQMLKTGRAEVMPVDNKRASVTREDCAAAAAGALTKSGTENKAYDITGPELVGTRDIAKFASEITGKRIEIVVGAAAPPGAPPAGAPAPAGAAPPSAPGAGANGPPPSIAGPPAVISNAVAELAGRPATSLKALLQANKDKLLAAAKS